MSELRRRAPEWIWPTLAVAATLIALRGVFTSSRIFFVRDLASYFWPHHLWLRATLQAGHLPVWNPNPGLGYPALADPGLALFFLPSLPFRLLLPDVIGFNVFVALPFPLAALGMYRFARSHASAPAAALAAIGYSVSGPVLSLANVGNPAWGAALAPWVLHAVDRLAVSASAPVLAGLAGVFACGVMGGEPVTLAGAAALALAYAACGVPLPTPAGRARVRLVATTLGAGMLGLLLAAIQLLPLLDTTSRSIRGAGWLADRWSLHPLRLCETLAYGLFGDYLGTPSQFGPWLRALNQGREPYLISLYVGAGALLLACVGVAASRPRRRAAFWAVTLASFLLLALGAYTPVYDAMRTLVPALRIFRYPIKHTVFVSLALAMLVALGWDALAERARVGGPLPRWPLALGVLLSASSLGVMLLLFAFPTTAHAMALALGGAVPLADPEAGAVFLLSTLRLAAPELLLIASAGTACVALAFSRRPEAPLARGVLLVMTALDPLATNGFLNPTLEAERLREPPWVAATRAHPSDRVFVAQDLAPSPGLADDDNPPALALPPAGQTVRVRALYGAMLQSYPAAWGVREALSTEATGLWPREYLDLLLLYEAAPREARTRFLQRAGTRYYVLPHAPSPEARALLELPGLAPLVLYEGPPPAPRAWVVREARNQPDVLQQIRALFDADFDPLAVVLLERDASPAGRPSPPQPASAQVVEDQPTRVCVRCSLPAESGYLVVSDAYEPNWRVRVDGQAAPLLRADGLFRGVHLASGSHDVCFDYESRPLFWGALVSSATLVGLFAMCFIAAWRRSRCAGARAGQRAVTGA